MSRSYLDLCKALVAELGVAGGNIAAVTGQSGELGNIVRWVADADLYIHNLWADWKFTWTSGPTGQLVNANGDTISSITDMASEIERGLVLKAETVSAYRPRWMPWPQFREQFKTRPKQTNPTPGYWTVRPDGVIELSEKVTDNTAWSLEYYRVPTRMVNNNDLSLIPTRFDRIIIARAAIMYGVREDAPEIVSGFAAEYDDTLEKMESAYLPGQRNSRRSQSDGYPQPDFLG